MALKWLGDGSKISDRLRAIVSNPALGDNGRKGIPEKSQLAMATHE